WLGEYVQYARAAPTAIWGGDRLEPRFALSTVVAGRERAILDSLAEPQWGVSLPQAAGALRMALSRPGFAERLAGAASRYRNAAVSRRLGFLVQWMANSAAARPFLSLRGSSHDTTPLLLGGPD